ncbi:MAG: nicotinate-nucleotide adenylyltransferase [Rhodospirillales bacterium]|nr:nicotinate-nucleotide adenylyltransferase [Rhodospirillales bacterium]
MRRRPPRRHGRRPRIGLLGGSFNPAHEGHLHISRLALEKLDLDNVWWLVSPHNPLKPEAEMAPLKERLRRARAIARGRKLWVTDIERVLGTRYTVDTLAVLREHYPGFRFVWIMGADNLIDIERWKDWTEIFHTVPVAVFARPNYSGKALVSKAARRFSRRRVKAERAAQLADRRPPAWVFLMTPLNAQSATRIRARGDKPAETRVAKRNG